MCAVSGVGGDSHAAYPLAVPRFRALRQSFNLSRNFRFICANSLARDSCFCSDPRLIATSCRMLATSRNKNSTISRAAWHCGHSIRSLSVAILPVVVRLLQIISVLLLVKGGAPLVGWLVGYRPTTPPSHHQNHPPASASPPWQVEREAHPAPPASRPVVPAARPAAPPDPARCPTGRDGRLARV